MNPCPVGFSREQKQNTDKIIEKWTVCLLCQAQLQVPASPQQPKSRFQAFKESPLYTIALNGAFFVAGVAFIQSPLMDMLAPQL